MEADLAESRKECEEQARLNGMGSSREAALQSALELSRREVEVRTDNYDYQRQRADRAESENAALRQEVEREKEYSAETHARFESQNDQITALRQEVERVKIERNAATEALTTGKQYEAGYSAGMDSEQVVIDTLRRQVEEQAAKLAVLWYCACGHNNGINLATCAACGRRPGARE